MLAEGTLHKRYRISWRRSSEEAAQPPQEVDQPQQEEDVCLSSRISDIASCCRLRISDRPGCSDCCDPEDADDAAATASPFPFSSYPSSTASSSTRKSGRRRRTHLPQLRPDTVKKVRVRTPRRSRLVLISTTILLPLLLLLLPSCWAVLLDANGESAAGPAGGGGGGAPFGDGVGLSLGGSFNLEKSIAAVFSRVAYGSTTTTKRSIPDNVYVPSLTTVSTPLLTTFRYREKDKDPGMSLGGSGSGGGALGGTDLLGPGPGPGGAGGAPHYNQQQISQNHRGYELDLERDHVLPTSAPNAEILKSNSNPTYPNPNRHHGHDRHRHSNSTPYPHGHPKKGFPTNPMFPGDIPSYSPPSRAFFTPPLPRNYTNPFADKPTLRGTNSDSTIINTNTYVNRRPLPPPSLMPGHERIPIRPDLNGSGAPAAPKVEEPVLVTGPASSSQSIEAQRRKPLNTPSEKSNKLEGGKSYGVDSKFMLDGGGNSSAILPNGMHFPSISRILSGSNGRTQTIPDVLLRSVTSAPRPNLPTFDLNAGGLPAVTSLSNAKNLNKGEGDEDGDGFEGGNENSGSRDEGEEEEDDDDGGGDDEEDVVGEKIDGSFYSTASVATSTVSSAGGHPASSSSPITQKMPNLNLKSVMIKANASGEEVGGGYGNDRNFATDIEDISTWTIAWNIHVYLSAILFTILAVYSIFKIIFYDKLTHLFSQSYFISIHLILIIICLLRIFYLCYDAYNIHFSFNLFTSELLLNLPLTFLTTTFAILILFLLLRSINHKTNRYSSILRPLTIMIGSGVHVGLCVTLHLVESYETQQFYHKQTQLLSRGGAAGHGPTNIQIPPRVLSLICQIIYIFICLSLGILYLYMYRLLKRILHKSQNYIHGYNNLSYAIHITIATALLFILLAALQIYGAISISSQTKVKLSPANMNDAAAAKKTLWASHIEIDWFQWGYQFSLRFIEIVIIALLSWVTGLKTGTSKGVPREKDMEQPNASGFALFPCTSSSSQENFETDYPAVCNANTNLHTYTLRTGKPIYDDNFALNSLNLEQNSAQDLQPNDFQRSIETNSMRSSSHNYSNNYNGSQQADQHDDFINDGEQMPDHYENPNFELKHHHRGEPPGGGPQYHDIMDNCYSEPINAPPYDTKSLRGNPGPPPPQPIHSQQNSRNYDFQNFERPSFDQAASSQSISRGEFRASKNLKTLKSGQAAAAAAAGGGYDGANTMGHHHYNHFNNYNDSFERRIGVRKSGTLNNIGHFNQHGGGGSGRNNNNSTSSASSSASSNNRAIAAQQAAGRPPRGGGHLNGAQTLGAGRADHHHHHHHHPQAAPRNLPPSEFPVHPGSFNDRLANGGGGSQDGINNFDDNSSSAASGAGNYYHSKKRSRESSSSSYTGFNGNGGAPGLEHGVPNDAGSSSPTASGSNVPINGLGGSSSGSSSGVLPGKMGPPPQTNGDNSSMLVAEQGFVRFRALEEPALGSQRTALRDKNKLFMNS